jgi:hypothetical protein
MIGLAITAALIVQTYDGQTKIVPNLSEAGCEVARCMAQFGKSCIAAAVDGVHDEQSRIAAVAYDKAHPWICPNPSSFRPLSRGASRSITD